jgi:hypothetical protein
VVHGVALIRKLLDQGLWDEADYRVFYNINFPPVAAADVKGIKVASQGFRRYTAFSLEPHLSPTGRQFLWIKGGEQGRPTLQGTDVTAAVEGYIAVTPLRAETTTTTRFPCDHCSLTLAATLRMRSTVPTDVPPYFWTIKAIAQVAKMRKSMGSSSTVFARLSSATTLAMLRSLAG